MLLTAAPYFKGFEFQSMIIFSLIMGLFDGCFITMLGPIAYDICGPAGASQAIGFLLGLCSIPLTLGPPIAGEGLDRIKDTNRKIRKTRFIYICVSKNGSSSSTVNTSEV